MRAYCPECETDLDQRTGICPACRWDPLLSSGNGTAKDTSSMGMSLTERYRGTAYDLSLQSEAMGHQAGFSRCRVFVIAGLVAGVGLYGVVLGVMGSM